MLDKVLISAAAILTAINVVITILNMRANRSSRRILEAIQAIEAHRAKDGGAIYWEPNKGESRKT